MFRLVHQMNIGVVIYYNDAVGWVGVGTQIIADVSLFNLKTKISSTLENFPARSPLELVGL